MGICRMSQELKQGLCINLELWNGEGEGREAQKGRDIYIPMADSSWFDRKQQILYSNYASI